MLVDSVINKGGFVKMMKKVTKKKKDRKEEDGEAVKVIRRPRR
jgi:hypothetical protein